jgi:hypothetical protein
MKTKNKIGVFLIIGFFFMNNLISCTTSYQLVNKTKREIIVYAQCSSQEVSSDILYSIYKIKDLLKEKKISVVMNHKKNQCGFLLIDGTQKRKITGAITDVDLSLEIERFYK